MNEKKISKKNNVEYINKKDTKIKQRPKKDENILVKPDKVDIRNLIWIIILFVIMFAALISLPYISNYR